MSNIRASVQNGRLLAALPEGTVLDLVVDDEGDDLDGPARAALNSAIGDGWALIQSGQGRSADEVLAALRKR
jgi:hypothetical protein